MAPTQTLVRVVLITVACAAPSSPLLHFPASSLLSFSGVGGEYLATSGNCCVPPLAATDFDGAVQALGHSGAPQKRRRLKSLKVST